MNQKHIEYLKLTDDVSFKRYFSSNKQVLPPLIKSFLPISNNRFYGISEKHCPVKWGSDKSVAIIKPNQSKYRDYGLPSVKELPNSAFAQTPKLLPKAESGDLAYAQIIKAVLGEGNSYRLIRTLRKPIVVTKEGLKHISKKREAFRERYANFILLALMEPNEIWLAAYEDGSLRRRFIKLFKGKKNMLVIARENIAAVCFGTLYQQDQNI